MLKRRHVLSTLDESKTDLTLHGKSMRFYARVDI